MKRWLSGWRALLPRACPGCGQQLGREAGLCLACRTQLRPRVESSSPLRPQPTPHLVSLGPYRSVTRRAVRTLKFGGARDLADVLGHAIAQGVPANWPLGAVIPVPLHPTRQRQRGFNQAELLAQAVAHELNLPCVSALERTRATQQQSRQHGRRADLHGAFRARLDGLPGGPVLLIDDVMTSGSTLLACQDALHAAGVRVVYVAVVAR